MKTKGVGKTKSASNNDIQAQMEEEDTEDKEVDDGEVLDSFYSDSYIIGSNKISEKILELAGKQGGDVKTKTTPSIKISFGLMNGPLTNDASISSISSLNKSNLSMSSLSSNSLKVAVITKEKFNRSSIIKKNESFLKGYPYVDQVIRLVRHGIFNF